MCTTIGFSYNKELNRIPAILQGFCILSQFDIPVGSVLDPEEG